MERETYDTLVVVTAADFDRLKAHYGRLAEQLPGRAVFVGSREVGERVAALNAREREAADGALNARERETADGAQNEREREAASGARNEWECDAADGARFGWIDEESLLPFAPVHQLMTERLSPLLQGRELPRGVTGWYYQQFLKLQYALSCEDTYYMVWDGDTVPCRPIEMFQPESGKPYFDMKSELHEGYFETIGRLFPGMGKVVARSFISEHMLFRVDIVREMLAELEGNGALEGTLFWEKILHAIPTEKLQESYFSEFETYGSYTVLRHMGEYALREWHSFRLAGEFFDPETITERDIAWLGRDFAAISFEKGHRVREDHKNLFDNPKYQEKLSARQMLEAVQDLFNGGYVEVWGD